MIIGKSVKLNYWPVFTVLKFDSLGALCNWVCLLRTYVQSCTNCEHHALCNLIHKLSCFSSEHE